jgi:hypothetical protein
MAQPVPRKTIPWKGNAEYTVSGNVGDSHLDFVSVLLTMILGTKIAGRC